MDLQNSSPTAWKLKPIQEKPILVPTSYHSTISMIESSTHNSFRCCEMDSAHDRIFRQFRESANLRVQERSQRLEP